MPPSTLSLLGLVRHVTDVERSRFRVRCAGEAVALAYATPERPFAAFEELDPTGASAAIDALIAEWAACHRAVADAALDATSCRERWGTMSPRRVSLHLIHEYAPHVAHADRLRERIDGTTD